MASLTAVNAQDVISKFFTKYQDDENLYEREYLQQDVWTIY